jgi:hypothetical protein
LLGRSNEPEITSRGCMDSDLARKWPGIVLWCLPTLALLAGFAWVTVRMLVWIPALLVMGIACVANARRCGRRHCYITGPIFLLAAIYAMLAEANIVSLRVNLFAIILVGAAALGCFAEQIFGRYVNRT